MVNWYFLIISSAALQGILLSLFLLKVKSNKESVRLLAPLVFVASISIVGRIFYDPSLFFRFAKPALLSDVFLFVYGPLLYLYIRTVFSTKRFNRNRIIGHFIPAILYCLWLVQFLFTDSSDIPVLLNQKKHMIGAVVTEILSWLQIAIYFYLSLIYFFRYHNEAKKYISNIPQTQFIKFLLTINLLILTVWLFGFTSLRFGFNLHFGEISYNLIWIFITFSIYLTGYNAIVFPQILRLDMDVSASKAEEPDIENHNHIISNEGNIDPAEKSGTDDSKVEQSALIRPPKKIKAKFDEQVLNELSVKLTAYMEQEKPFLNPDLTLPSLSARLSTSTHYLSRVINSHHQLNFFDFINRYRVNYFLTMLKNDQNKKYTIMSLAFDCGFNSKSAFNNAFKKVTGQTPTQVLKSTLPQQANKDICTEL